VVLDVTAKTQDGTKVFSHQRSWQEIGVDLSGDQQVKSWEIKNTIDEALQPRRTHTETLTIPVPEGTKTIDIEAILTYHHRPGEEFIVHRVTKKLAIKK
jgi:hypothetical protein